MATSIAPTARASRGLHVSLWVLQVLLAGVFASAGYFKIVTPVEALQAQMGWVASAPSWLPGVIGTFEVLGALGLILPSALRIAPRLSAWAAAGLATIMVLALGVHVSRGEANMFGPVIVLGTLAALVAWGRGTRAPIAAK